MDNLFEQLTNISKAHAYDILVEQVKELKEENEILKNRVKFLENLIKEYTGKMINTLEGGKVDDAPR